MKKFDDKIRVVLIGGGHTNVQVLKILNDKLPPATRSKVDLTLISKGTIAFYSGMLPGSVAKAYNEEQITIDLRVLSISTNTNLIETPVKNINPDQNEIVLEDERKIDYDFMSFNIGSRTQGTYTVEGVQEHTLPTRPINNLLARIEEKEKTLMELGRPVRLVVCGAGIAGVELALNFKTRWDDLFQTDTQVTIINN